ncbi:MAG: outer membrane beta-barrel protein, partial [Bacteroidia bacterium]|nr:outer membrane beta-barrel protein [Bacteroidia bacterium]
GYVYTDKPIAMNIIQNKKTSSTSIITYKNYDKYQNINSLITFRDCFNFWQTQLTIGGIFPFFTAEYKNEMLERNNPSFSLKFYNDFTLNDYIFSINYYFQSNYESYITKYDLYHKIDLSLRKSFLNKSLTASLVVNDIFNWVKENSTRKIDNFLFTQTRKRETRFWTFTINYSFNNFKKSYKGRGASSDRDRL